MPRKPHKTIQFLALAVLSLAISACSTMDRISTIGNAPSITPINKPNREIARGPVTMPMPSQHNVTFQPNSLWRSGARQFFEDQRAAQIGDILTVNIDITDEASINNTTTRSRSNEEDADVTNMLGFEGSLASVLPNGFSPSNAVGIGSGSKSTGTGTVDRAETVKLTVAAIVTQVLPNGNMVIQGRQEMRVNFEMRELLITGVVRPEDISNSNTIEHEQIAEARISYGGRGHLTDVQQARYGQQIFDIVFPF
jgi:flagellar L-ring protein precursor FlgH